MAHRILEKQTKLPPLRVLPRGTATVRDYRALMEGRTSRKIGWRWDGTLGPLFTDSNGIQRRHGARVKRVDEVVVIPTDDPYYGEYVKALQSADLWAADPETAAAAGVPFEPHFGGEHPATSAKHGLDEAKIKATLRECGFPEDAGAAAIPWDADFAAKFPPVLDATPEAMAKATPMPTVAAKSK
jgi:hypothetical protein